MEIFKKFVWFCVDTANQQAKYALPSNGSTCRLCGGMRLFSGRRGAVPYKFVRFLFMRRWVFVRLFSEKSRFFVDICAKIWYDIIL